MTSTAIESVYSTVTLRFGAFTVDVSSRLFEWHASMILIGIGVLLLWPGEMARYGTFQSLYEQGLSEAVMGSIFMSVGVARFVALLANGHVGPIGPRIRATGALLGAVVWVQLSCSLLSEANRTGRVSIGIVVYASLALCDLISCWRATLDVRRNW